VKLAYFSIPGLLLVVEGVLAFSGCGSTSSSPDGGQCQPSCPEASDESFPETSTPRDAGTDAIPETDGGQSCISVCERLTHFKGCPDPGCTVACQRLETLCTTALGVAAFDALLACEMSAHYTCVGTMPPLPVASGCATEMNKVASACPAEAGVVEAGCSKTVSTSDCMSCCAGLHAEGYDTYGVALTDCACDTPGLCDEPPGFVCENSECMGATPEAGSSCANCLAKVSAPDGGCASALSEACGSDPDCVAYETCLTTYGCSKK
jgi:hypothetical protein